MSGAGSQFMHTRLSNRCGAGRALTEKPWPTCSSATPTAIASVPARWPRRSSGVAGVCGGTAKSIATPGARPSVSPHLFIGVILLILVAAIFLVLQTDIPDAVGWVLFLLGIASLIGGVAFVASGSKKR